MSRRYLKRKRWLIHYFKWQSLKSISKSCLCSGKNVFDRIISVRGLWIENWLYSKFGEFILWKRIAVAICILFLEKCIFGCFILKNVKILLLTDDLPYGLDMLLVISRKSKNSKASIVIQENWFSCILQMEFWRRASLADLKIQFTSPSDRQSLIQSQPQDKHLEWNP